MLLRTAKSCGPDTPTLVSSSRSCVGPTGLRQDISADDGGKTAPVTKSTKETVKTIACGNAGRFRCTRCYSCAFYQYKVHTRPRVQRAPGIPHALMGRKIKARLGRIASRGANLCLEARVWKRVFGIDRHGERRRDQATDLFPQRFRSRGGLRAKANPSLARFPSC